MKVLCVTRASDRYALEGKAVLKHRTPWRCAQGLGGHLDEYETNKFGSIRGADAEKPPNVRVPAGDESRVGRGAAQRNPG